MDDLLNEIKTAENFIAYLEASIEYYQYNVKRYTKLSKKYPSDSYYKEHIKTDNDKVQDCKERLMNEIKKKTEMQRKYLHAFGREEIKVIKEGLHC